MTDSRDAVGRIADAVLYEGYILWPYRRSAMKNQRRWTFGGVYPRAHSEGRADDPWTMQTQCLVEGGPESTVDVRVRFLHVVARSLLRATSTGLDPVDELEVDGERHVSWDEATEREIRARGLPLGRLEAPCRLPIEVEAGSEREHLTATTGDTRGVVVRSWRALSGSIEVRAQPVRRGLFRLAVRVANESPWRGGDREEALRQTFCSCHAVLRTPNGGFVSLTEPPEELRGAAESCVNSGTWPVLVGDRGDRGTLLSSPIILPDYPEVAPESPGDLFDGGEIDQLLTLNILSLTDDEKREMRASDPRAREILDRTEGLSNEELIRLHGAIREFQSARLR